MDAGAGTQVHHVVRAANGLLVMLHHQHRVAQVAELLERGEQAAVVPRVQADGGLVQHIEHAAQLRADLRGQADALRFPAGKRGRGTVQAQVAEPHGQQEVQPLANFLQHALRDFPLAGSELAADLVHRAAGEAQRHGGELRNGVSTHAHGQAFRPQPLLAARRARRGRHVFQQPLLIILRGRFLVVAPQHLQHAGEMQAGPGTDRTGARRRILWRIAVEDQVLRLARELFHRRLEREAVGHRGQLQRALQVQGARAGAQPALEERLGPVRDYLRRIEIIFRAQTVALRAGAVRRIETEGARLELRHGGAAIGAGQFFRIHVLRAAHHGHRRQALRQFQRGLHGLLQAFGDPGLHQQAVHHHFYGVVLAPVQTDFFIQVAQLSVNPRADESLARQGLQLLAILALPAAHHRRQNHHALLRLERKNGLHDLLGGLPGNGPATARAVRRADGAVEHAQVVVDFRDRAHGGARRARGGLLLDGNGRRKALDGVHVRPLHLVQKLPGIGGERFHVAPLAFGVDGVKRQRGLAGAGGAGDYRERVAGNFQADVLEVVLARALNDDFLEAHR